MRIVAALVFAVTVGLLAGQAAADVSDKDAKDCDQKTNDDRRIAGCTRVLNTKGITDRIRAIAHSKRGIAWSNKNQNDKALEDYSAAIRFDPNFTDALENRGNLYKDRQDYNQAVNAYNAYIRQFPTVVTAKVTGAKPRKYFTATGEAQQGPPTVDFSKPTPPPAKKTP